MVVSDDTMSGIAERFRVCVRDIARANDDNLDVFVDESLTIKRTTDIDVGSAECKESSV
ncbi:LysM peptidoglycan-binding domain-containing protein [Microlunatus antarcticus]|uniref:LysM repeat protein n=1 Tax=Microlunatus antarcticus TaxID=53388 RepID=A0A7W5JWM9_9ACTN|nr:LysM repeat protein [Microlunatus antarcticus]